jgi:hypothetical protein
MESILSLKIIMSSEDLQGFYLVPLEWRPAKARKRAKETEVRTLDEEADGGRSYMTPSQRLRLSPLGARRDRIAGHEMPVTTRENKEGRSWDEEFKGFAAAANSIDWDSLIERCQFAPFVNGQSKEIHVGDLRMCDDHIHIPRPVRVVRVAGNADESVFRERTGCPGLPTLFHEPAMG